MVPGKPGLTAIVAVGVARTVTVASPELAAAHTPLCTTALKYVVVVNAPIAAPVNVAEVLAISVTADKKSLTVDFCHFVTLPVLPDNVKSAGVLPLQIV